MEIREPDCCETVQTALKEAGLKVDGMVKHGKKTVITVSRKEQVNINSVHQNSNFPANSISREEKL
jgi:hypothetical protein